MADSNVDLEEKAALTGESSYENFDVAEQEPPMTKRRKTFEDRVPKKWQSVLTIIGVAVVLTAIVVTLYISLSPQSRPDSPLPVPATPKEDGYDEAERVALEELFMATAGFNWTQKDNWMSEESICNWFGVWCDFGQIRSLSLVRNNLRGTLPASIGSMPTLRQINLPYNNLHGTVPKELGNSTSLRVLVISFNNLTGVLPIEELASLKLQSINFKGNALTGELPVEFVESVELSLDLSSNNFYGTLPDLQSESLTTLRLSKNQFTGSLPLLPPNLTRLSLDQNMLMGDTHNLLPLKGIQRLNISGNNFTGEFMLDEEQFALLEYLNIAHNAFTSVRASNVTLVPECECHAENTDFTCPMPDWLYHCSATCNNGSEKR
jgi:hypothetical protein